VCPTHHEYWSIHGKKYSFFDFDSRSSWGSDLLFNHLNLIPFGCSSTSATMLLLLLYRPWVEITFSRVLLYIGRIYWMHVIFAIVVFFPHTPQIQVVEYDLPLVWVPNTIQYAVDE
jgi:hypothetical protein